MNILSIKYPRNQGFTLIEITIAILILFIGVLGIAQLFIASTYSNKYAQNTTLAIKAAKNVIEELRAINNWATDPRIQVGGTVLMQSDGGGIATSLSTAAQAHISGVYLSPVTDTTTGRVKYYEMKETQVGDSNWAKRTFEVRWQVIGYNSSGSVDPGGVSLTNAYTTSSNIPNFSSLLSSPTPTKSGTSEQTSVYVIIRVAPVVNDTRISKKIQLATLLVNPVG
jgi:type IV pilus modification protein PilV